MELVRLELNSPQTIASSPLDANKDLSMQGSPLAIQDGYVPHSRSLIDLADVKNWTQKLYGRREGPVESPSGEAAIGSLLEL